MRQRGRSRDTQIFTNPFSRLTASGTGQGSATQLPSFGDITTWEVVSVPIGSGVMLPIYTTGACALGINNANGNDLLVYPVPGGTIDNQPVDVPYTVPSLKMVTFWSFSPVDWLVIGGGSAPPAYLPPAFTAFSIQGQTSHLEVGATISSGSKTFLWGTSNSGNVKAASIEIDDVTGSAVLASGLDNTGSEAISISAITEVLPSTYTWEIKGVNSQNNNMTPMDYSVGWLWRIYAGTNSDPELTANQIKALSDFDGLAAGFQGTYIYADVDGYHYLAYPDSMGSVLGFIDANTGFPVSMAEVTDDAAYSNSSNGWFYALVNVINQFGVATNYRLYRTQNTFSGSFSMRVS